MNGEGINFLVKVHCEWNVAELVQKLNELLLSQLAVRGGQFGNNYASIYHYDFYDSNKPISFSKEGNYKFEIFVSLVTDNDPTDEQYIENIQAAQNLKSALEAIDCTTHFIFTYSLPNGDDPNELLNKT